METEDIPASLNYVLKTTEETNISFVCLSFGCTLFFMALITKPELNNAIDIAVTIAPSSGLLFNDNPFICDFLYPYGNELEVPNDLLALLEIIIFLKLLILTENFHPSIG